MGKQKKMRGANLRLRIRIFGVLVILAVAIFSFTLVFTLVNDRAARLEADQTATDVQRALNALDEELYQLEAAASDLATWDDTYAYLAEPDPAYTEASLTDEFFLQSGINLVALVDSELTVAFTKAFDLDEKREIPFDLREYVTPGSPLVAGFQQEEVVSGLLLLPGTAMLVTSEPVLTSDGEGPARGALIMGRYIDDSFLLKLEGDLQLSVAIGPAAAMQLPEAFWSRTAEDPVVVEPLDNSTVIGYLPLEDVYGEQSLILRVFLPRDIYNESIRSASFLSGTIILLVSSSLVLFLWIFDRQVLKRLAVFDAFLRNYDAREFKDPPHLAMTGDDELTRLSVSLNEMIDRQSEIQRDLNVIAEENSKLSRQTKEQYEKEREMRQALQEEIEKRVEFAKALGHELRTPVTPILASIELLKNQTDDSRSQGLIQIIERSAKNLHKRMGDILDLAKAEVNMLSLDLSIVEPGKIFEEVSSAMETVAEKNRQHLICNIPADLPDIVTDRDRFQRVLENLLGNALKYTHSGGTIVFTAKEENRQLTVEVRDNGMGISEEEKTRIFDPYHRQTGKEQLGGLGLGLAFSKKFLDLQGGRMWVNSEPGKGSVFGFSLPLQHLNTDGVTSGENG